MVKECSISHGARLRVMFFAALALVSVFGALAPLSTPTAQAQAATTCEAKYPITGTDAEKQKAQDLRDVCNSASSDFCATPAVQQDAEKKAACQFGLTAAPSTPPTGSGQATPEEGKKPKECELTGFGWIICLATQFMAKIADGVYSYLKDFLQLKPLLTTGAYKGVYDGWSIMRNFANIAFVVMFLVIVFSQITSAGISNYGIKRMLPRLIIAAILVNTSYWICAIAVDLSNVLGSSLKGLLDAIAGGIQVQSSVTWESETRSYLSGVLVGGAALGVTVYVAVSALIPILLMSLVIIMTIFLTLIIREVLVILLVVVSPLAFVAYLLPNTEGLFRRWSGLMRTLLLLYPIISLIFGASALAAKVIQASAG